MKMGTVISTVDFDDNLEVRYEPGHIGIHQEVICDKTYGNNGVICKM